MIRDLIQQNRSYRRFDSQVAISRETLLELVDLARLSGSGANLQPLKFHLSHTAATNDLIFPLLGWAGYLEDWPGPAPGERPTAYITILGDKRIREGFGCDHGIAAQSILLGAVEQGLGGCMIGSVERKELRAALDLPEHFDILLVLALGKPAEQCVIEPLDADGSIKYWRDDQEVHHVPKRPLDEIVLGSDEAT